MPLNDVSPLCAATMSRCSRLFGGGGVFGMVPVSFENQLCSFLAMPPTMSDRC